MGITQAEVALAILMFCLMCLSFYAGYYSALKQAKDAIRYAKSVVRQQQIMNEMNK